MSYSEEFIQAAGAVLWRRDREKVLEVALIHRPRYDDWSLPKGKLEKGESHIACAYREVQEETGFSAVFGPELGETIYKVEGQLKVAKYWSAEATGKPLGKVDPKEIDKLLWLTPIDAKEKLTNKDDCKIIDFFLEFGPDTTPLILLRHAKAVKREDWDGDDGDRPLDTLGQKQAKRFLPNFLPYGLKEVHSSDAMRCLETLELLDRSLDIQAKVSQDLSEYGYARDKDAPVTYVEKIVKKRLPTLICSHNPILPKVVKSLIGKKNFKNLDYEKLSPGDAWVLHHRDGEIIAVDWVLAPLV
ncbi:MAG: NUDIX hydrolase [Actinobacteria bacterium]|nr:NUDIX hydrolase [Actinomycetota bacterium]